MKREVPIGHLETNRYHREKGMLWVNGETRADYAGELNIRHCQQNVAPLITQNTKGVVLLKLIGEVGKPSTPAKELQVKLGTSC